jgi:hypothetical protein
MEFLHPQTELRSDPSLRRGVFFGAATSRKRYWCQKHGTEYQGQIRQPHMSILRFYTVIILR